ncbi:hypothetical protein PED39_02400 [Methanomassiliicoccales archaeon LGM-RCC1]|nr:hypothetical protein PED39_02400 [Methanomassiliicoccales archaeon LGM-RCC1]
MTEVTEEMKRQIARLCSQPANLSDYDSWTRDVPDFAERCNYVPGPSKNRKKEE